MIFLEVNKPGLSNVKLSRMIRHVDDSLSAPTVISSFQLSASMVCSTACGFFASPYNINFKVEKPKQLCEIRDVTDFL